MEECTKSMKSDLLIEDMISNIPRDIYGLNPLPTIKPLKKSDFDKRFRNFEEIIRKNIEFCSLEVYNKLIKWLKGEAYNALINAETAFCECSGYTENQIKAIEDYFLHANERVINLIDYINSQKNELNL